MAETKFYICDNCKNIVTKLKDSKVPVVCCGKKMTELVPGTVEASHEKHIPVVTALDGKLKVSVGTALHPMTQEHSIEWIYLETSKGGQLKHLSPADAPEATFALSGETPLAVYAYCNLHGLWKTEI